LRDKEEELERFKLMIKDKRIEIDAKGQQHSHMGSP
jgi:hypothetical protein